MGSPFSHGMNMKEIKLSKSDAVTIVDEDDFIRFNAWNWRLSTFGYAISDVAVSKRPFIGANITWLHRVIMACPEDMYVDHINGDKLDNRKCNLRICTSSQNQANKKIDSSIHLEGAYLNKSTKKWYTRLSRKINGTPTVIKFLGYFDTKEEAHEAFKKAHLEYYGEYSRFFNHKKAVHNGKT